MPNEQRNRINSSNRFGVDYEQEARAFGAPVCPIIDMHTHLNGEHAAQLWLRAADAFGIDRVFSMTPFDSCAQIKGILGDRVSFIAVPNWQTDDPRHAHGAGFLKLIDGYHAIGARIVKLFAAPRMRDRALELGDPEFFALDGPLRRATANHAMSLGMAIMTHIADPDTWFATAYSDSAFYGTKRDQYVPLERMLDDYPVKWIAAHMGGSPEHLDVLNDLLERHSNLHIDTSACKWIARELGRQPTARVREFFQTWRGRVFFGSDILTTDSHLQPSDVPNLGNVMEQKAGSPAEAFDLYASRYFTLRKLFESTERFSSPIADPDLNRVAPDQFTPHDAPDVQGHALDGETLRWLYRDAAEGFLAG